MYECGTCGKAFRAGLQAREQHCDATGHSPPRFECDSCDAYFRSERAMLQHMSATGHFDDDSNYDDDSDYGVECTHCDLTFDTLDQREDHEVEDHFYCHDCDRTFVNYGAIEMHLMTSSAHLGRTQAVRVKCHFCKAMYSTAAAMTDHLESATCPGNPKITRDEVYKMIRAKDPNNLISRHSVAWEHTTSVKHNASSNSWNGKGYQCYFCDRAFEPLDRLNQHLNSPIHHEELYHCPNRKCGMRFKTLAALVSHLETKSCGAMRFGTVQRRIGDIVSGNRLLRL